MGGGGQGRGSGFESNSDLSSEALALFSGCSGQQIPKGLNVRNRTWIGLCGRAT